MPRKLFRTEEIIRNLHEAKVLLSQGSDRLHGGGGKDIVKRDNATPH